MEQRYQRIKSIDETLWNIDCPIFFNKGALLRDNKINKNILQLQFVNCSDKIILAAYITILCFDVFDQNLDEIKYCYNDLNIKPGEKFGENVPVEVNNEDTRKYEFVVNSVLYEEGAKENIDLKLKKVDSPKSIKCLGELADEYLTELAENSCEKGLYFPEVKEGFWICTCGNYNSNLYTNCRVCLNSKDKLFLLLNKTKLKEHLQNRNEYNHKKAVYDYAKQLVIQKKYNLAYEQYQKINNFLDSDILKEKCKKDYIEYCESNYKLGLELFKSHKYKDAEKVLKEIEEYKDVRQLICEIQELCKREDNKKKKNKKIIIATVVIFCIILVTIGGLLYAPTYKRNKIDTYVKNKDWDAAINLCKELNLAEEINEVYYMQAQDLENTNIKKAIQVYSQIADSNTDARNRIDELQNYLKLEGQYTFYKDDSGLGFGRGGDIDVTIIKKDEKIMALYKWDEMGSACGPVGEEAVGTVDSDTGTDLYCSFKFKSDNTLRVRYFFTSEKFGDYDDGYIYVKKEEY